MSDPLTSSTKPLTSATLTVRIVKSFEYRTQKALVLQGVDLTTETVGSLIEKCLQGTCARDDERELTRVEIKTRPGFKPYKNLHLGTYLSVPLAFGSRRTLRRRDAADDDARCLARFGACSSSD
jgi:hypothetical protein